MTQTFNGAARIIAGRRFVLAFTFSALCELHKVHPNIMSAQLSADRMGNPNEIRELLRLGLGRQVRTDADVCKLVDLLRINGALQWIGEALTVAFGASEGEPVNRPKAQPYDGTGPKSWRNGLSWAAILTRFGIRPRAVGALSSEADTQP